MKLIHIKIDIILNINPYKQYLYVFHCLILSFSLNNIKFTLRL